MIKAEVKYSRSFASYYILLVGHMLASKFRVAMKFDTGATRSIISVWSLFPGITIEKVAALKASFELHRLKTEDFKVANGNQISGYPCIIKDVELGGMKIDNFCFYLTLDTSVDQNKQLLKPRTALLGDDFISSCSFSHECDSDIKINDYNHNLAYKKFTEKCTPYELNEVMLVNLLENNNEVSSTNTDLKSMNLNSII